MTISVPQELKDRMEAVDEPVSWSAVACEAFKQKLAEIIKRKGAKDMSDVISRLRASKVAAETKSYNDGFAFGERWAKGNAEVAELNRLERFHEETEKDYPFEDWFGTELFAPWSHTSHIVAAIYGTEYPREAEELTERLFDEEEARDNDYVRGFVEGALSVWNDVKDQI